MLKSVVYLRTNEGAPVMVHPLYGNDVSLSRNRESGQRYFRESISGDFIFIGDEFGTIYNGSIDNEYKLQIVLKDTISGTEYPFGEAIFHKIDCEFDLDSATCTVKLTTSDKYNKILQGIDNEYNLVNLAPDRETVTITKRPVLQIYMLGDNKITGVIGNSPYEVDTNRVVDYEHTTYELSQMHFGLLHRRAQYYVEIDESQLRYFPVEALGYYYGVYSQDNGRFTNDNGYYFIVTGASYMKIQIYDKNGIVIDNYYLESFEAIFPSDLMDLNLLWRPSAEQSGIIYGKATIGRRFVYGRFLSDNPILGEQRRIPDNDISESNLNYHYAIPATEINTGDVASMVSWNRATSVEPTKWGRGSGDLYFEAPAPQVVGDSVIPIGFNTWIPEAFWFESQSRFFSDESLIAEVDIKDTYPIESVIQVLLKAIGVDNDISFEGTPEYSEFLFGEYVPIQNRLGHTQSIRQRLFITPITHIKKTYYSQAAQRGNIKLSDIFDMLQKCFQCYWFIDNTGKLRIEHISWFKNGGSYNSDSRVILANLTNSFSPRNGKPWSFAQNKVKYDKTVLNNRYEFGYSEETTPPFNGYALDVKNPFCKSGNKQSIKVNNFLADLDYIISTPFSVSDDVFALLGADYEQSPYKVPIRSIYFAPGKTEFDMQNPYLSFLYMECTYWDYDASGDELYSQDFDAFLSPVRGTKRIVTQEGVSFPCSLETAQSEGLIVTELGQGEIQKISLNLSSMMAQTTLVYDTE